MIYLKWLVDKNGERVEANVARQAFEGDCNASEIVKDRGWTFVPMLGLTLEEWIVLHKGFK